MHTADQYIAELRAEHLIKRCRSGFKNEFEWLGWRKKHAKEIEALPLDLRNRVVMIWDNATSKEHSR